MTFLPTAEGGRSRPARSGYRPNHNFGAPDDTLMQIGKVDFEGTEEVQPGESANAIVTFLSSADVGAKLQVGREWRVQEGFRLVARAKVVEVLREA